MRRRRLELGPEAAREAGEALVARVRGTLWWREARSVLGYVALRGEIDPGPLMEEALRTGKLLCLPRPDPELKALRPCPWDGRTGLVPGPYGIPVPPPSPGRACEDPALVLVPGFAFDLRGNRLGAGGGYYDRYLRAAGTGWALGVGYDWQVVPSVPVEPHDRPLDAVVTPLRFLAVLGEPA